MEIILVAEWFEFPFGIKPWGCLSLGPLLANSGETVLDNLILMKSPTWGFTCKLVRITNQHNSITLSSLSYFWSSDHCSRFLKCPRTRVKVRSKWRFIIFLIHKWGICVDINSIQSFIQGLLDGPLDRLVRFWSLSETTRNYRGSFDISFRGTHVCLLNFLSGWIRSRVAVGWEWNIWDRRGKKGKIKGIHLLWKSRSGTGIPQAKGLITCNRISDALGCVSPEPTFGGYGEGCVCLIWFGI